MSSHYEFMGIDVKNFVEALFFTVLWSSCFVVVVTLDWKALWSLRGSRVEAMARFLWMVWVVAVPVIGAITYFIVQPTREEGEREPRDWPLSVTDPERRRQSEAIQR